LGLILQELYEIFTQVTGDFFPLKNGQSRLTAVALLFYNLGQGRNLRLSVLHNGFSTELIVVLKKG
jgi:hypothetical protein